jgi:flagellar biosynthesis/type III secretory pathway protein FliH
MLSTYEVRGIKKGLEQGIIQGIERGKVEGKREGIVEGIVEGKRDALLLLLRHKFGDIPNNVMDRVARINSLEELDAIISKAFDAESLEALGI